MSNEYANLLAQVVPVLALALGLEVRSLVAYSRKAAEEQTRRGEKPAFPFWAGLAWGAAFAALVTLAAIEIKALYVVSGREGFWDDTTVPTAVAIVFMIPFAAGFYTLRQDLGWDKPTTIRWAVVATTVALGIGVLEFLTI